MAKTQKTVISDRESIMLSDQESESNSIRRGRPSIPAELILAAADQLFSVADSPGTVTMEAIARAACVGKGTLFRAFGSRNGLLDALWEAKLGTLRKAVEVETPPLGFGGPPRVRAVAFLDALLTFKLENRHLIRARETPSLGLRQSEQYKWMHGLLRDLLKDATRGGASEEVDYKAHVLLGALHIDLIEDLLATGQTSEEIRRSQAALTRAVIDDARLA
ncbi:TetR/AcrR family transcriptional regulator [Rahnella aceris]|nr:TetR/AcrR family transcriptional regulator [Rahnella aceris]